MIKVMITGANGQLGADILSVLQHKKFDVLGLTHQDVDIGDIDRFKQLFDLHQPDVLINTAAFHNVNACELDPSTAKYINTDAPARMAALCTLHQKRFIHFSTDYVFDGAKGIPYTEDDQTAPLNVYGETKRAGESQVLLCGPDHLVLRVSALYGHHPCRAKNGLNFIRLMLKLAAEKGEVTVVDDEYVSPTSTRNIAEMIPLILNDTSLEGIVHLTSEGECSWYDFAAEIFSYTHTPVKLNKAAPSTTPPEIRRPKYSVLENRKWNASGFPKMNHWKASLFQYLDELKTKEETNAVQVGASCMRR